MSTHPLDDISITSNLFYPRKAVPDRLTEKDVFDGTIPVDEGIEPGYRFYHVKQGQQLFDASPSQYKTLVVIRGASHNDILVRDMAAYFGAVGRFLDRHS